VFVAKEVHPESKTSMKYVDDQPTWSVSTKNTKK
jgi:hypothetical protein